MGGIKALSGVVAILDSTQDLLCKKLTNHFVTLCLNLDNNSSSNTSSTIGTTDEKKSKRRHRKHVNNQENQENQEDEDAEDEYEEDENERMARLGSEEGGAKDEENEGTNV